MKNKFIIILILLTGFQNIFAQKQPIYPEPEKGFKRVDLQLPKIENENDFKIEITFGMESESDECTKLKVSKQNMLNLQELTHFM